MSRNLTPGLASLIESFFTRRLLAERRASPHTVGAYRDTFRLLPSFAQRQFRRAASALEVGDLDAALISKFLTYLEKERGNSARTRNARLAAIHSFFRYVALEDPLCGTVALRVLGLPSKRTHRALVEFLDERETEAVLGAIDLDRSVAAARRTCKSLQDKRVTPHVLRHTAAMTLLHAGVDRSVIALWLGHETVETTDIYLHADMELKERALARTAPVRQRNKRFRPSDRLLAFLETL
jgi:site-specific recombinase XerD